MFKFEGSSFRNQSSAWPIRVPAKIRTVDRQPRYQGVSSLGPHLAQVSKS